MMHVIPFHVDGQRPDEVEAFILANEWTHSAFVMFVNDAIEKTYFTMVPATADRERHLMHVMCGDGSFAYSIGNHTRNLPELLVLGDWPFDVTAATLNLLSEKFEAEGEQLGVVDIGFLMPVKVREASAKAKEEYTFQAT